MPVVVKTTSLSSEKLKTKRTALKKKIGDGTNVNSEKKNLIKLQDLVKGNSMKRTVVPKKIIEKEKEVSKVSLKGNVTPEQISKENMNKIKDLITKMRAELKTLKEQSSGNSQNKQAAVQYVVSKIKQEIKNRTESLKAAQELEKKKTTNSVVISPSSKEVKVTTPSKFERRKNPVPKTENKDDSLKKKKSQIDSEINLQKASSDKDINVACDEIQCSLLDYYLHYGQLKSHKSDKNDKKNYVFPFSKNITPETKNALLRNGVIVDPNYRRRKCFISYNRNNISRRNNEINLPPPQKNFKSEPKKSLSTISEPQEPKIFETLPTNNNNLEVTTNSVLYKLKQAVDAIDTTYNYATGFSNKLSNNGLSLCSNLFTNLKPNPSLNFYISNNSLVSSLMTQDMDSCSKEPQGDFHLQNKESATLINSDPNKKCLFSFEVSDQPNEKFVVSIENKDQSLIKNEYNIDDISISIRSPSVVKIKSLRELIDTDMKEVSSKAIALSDSIPDDQSIESLPNDLTESNELMTDLQTPPEIDSDKKSEENICKKISEEKLFDSKVNSMKQLKSTIEIKLCKSSENQMVTTDLLDSVLIKSTTNFEQIKYIVLHSPVPSGEIQIVNFPNNASIVAKASRVLSRLCCQVTDGSGVQVERPKSSTVDYVNSNRILQNTDNIKSWVSMTRLNKSSSPTEKTKIQPKKSSSMHCSTFTDLSSTSGKKPGSKQQMKAKLKESNSDKKRKQQKSESYAKTSFNHETIVNNTNRIFERMCSTKDWPVTECLESESDSSVDSTKNVSRNREKSAESIKNIEEKESFLNMQILNDKDSDFPININFTKNNGTEGEADFLKSHYSNHDSLDESPIDERVVSDRIFVDEIKTLEEKLDNDEKLLSLSNISFENDIILDANEHLLSAQELIIDVITIDKTIQQNDDFINELYNFDALNSEIDDNSFENNIRNINALAEDSDIVKRNSIKCAVIDHYIKKYSSSHKLQQLNETQSQNQITDITETVHVTELKYEQRNDQQILPFYSDLTLQNYRFYQNCLLQLCLMKVFYDFFQDSSFIDSLIDSENNLENIKNQNSSIVEIDDSYRSLCDNKCDEKPLVKKFKSKIPVRKDSSVVTIKLAKSSQIATL